MGGDHDNVDIDGLQEERNPMLSLPEECWRNGKTPKEFAGSDKKQFAKGISNTLNNKNKLQKREKSGEMRLQITSQSIEISPSNSMEET